MPNSDPEVRKPAIELIKNLPDIHKVLDIGVGYGYYGKTLKGIDSNINIYGIEIWPRYITDQLDYYKTIYLCNFLDFEYEKLSIDFDLVILADIIEHVPKDKAIYIINKLRSLYPRIVLTCPIIPYPQGPYEDNVYETHLHDWTISEVVEDLGLQLVEDCGTCGLFMYTQR